MGSLILKLCLSIYALGNENFRLSAEKLCFVAAALFLCIGKHYLLLWKSSWEVTDLCVRDKVLQLCLIATTLFFLWRKNYLPWTRGASVKSPPQDINFPPQGLLC